MFRRLLADQASEEKLREIIETPSGLDKALWQQMAELGLTGIMIPAELGGIGGSIEEVEALMEVAGASLYNGPFISTSVIAPILLSAATNTEFVSALLEDIASGEKIIAIAGCGRSGDWTKSPEVSAKQNGSEWILSGSACFVQHARNADAFLVATAQEGNVAVFYIPKNAPGLDIVEHDTDDKTLRLSTVDFDKAQGILLEGVGEEQFKSATQSAIVALAGEQAGATRQIFDLTIEYLNTRFQFGQPIGRFQALKHMAADLLIEVESASSSARHAARALASKAPNASMLAYLAKFTCADNFRKVSADAIQLHGGIAYTVEHPAHLYWRRAQTGQWLFGSSDRFRDLYLSEMETAP